MSPSPQALENTLFKAFEISSATLADLTAFDAVLEPVFEKASAIKAMRQYLVGTNSCPRILGALVYSSQGHVEIGEWLDAGMPIRLLYRCMMSDAGAWAQVGAPLPLTRTIIESGQEWDFDYKLLNSLDYATCIPGLVEAILQRAVRHHHESELLEAVTLKTLEGLLERHREVLEALVIKAKNSPTYQASGDSITDLALDLVRSLLDPVLSIKKVLLRPPY